jgi:RNA-directed DNA polymerase
MLRTPTPSRRPHRRSQPSTHVDAICGLDGRLPQGSPASQMLANLAFVEIDESILRICERHQITYTRYVDDLALSGRQDFSHLRREIIRRIEWGGYRVSARKVFFRRRNERQVVTGLVVNDFLRPTKKFRAAVKSEIRRCVEQGPKAVARLQGLTSASLRQKLNGLISYVAQFDTLLARQLSGLMYAAWGAER